MNKYYKWISIDMSDAIFKYALRKFFHEPFHDEIDMAYEQIILTSRDKMNRLIYLQYEDDFNERKQSLFLVGIIISYNRAFFRIAVANDQPQNSLQCNEYEYELLEGLNYIYREENKPEDIYTVDWRIK